MVSRSFSVVGHNDCKEDKVVNESGFTIVSRFGSSFLNATTFFSYSVWTAANSASVSSRWIFLLGSCSILIKLELPHGLQEKVFQPKDA